MKKSYIFNAFIAFIFCTFFIISCEKENYNITNPTLVGAHPIDADEALPYQFPDWMSGLSDSISLAMITIPGTHDCGADLHTSAQGVESYITICQDYRLSNQLKLGVRWFDVRLDDGMKVRHDGYDLNKNFDNLLIAARDFLNAHPTEVVIFVIKQEHTNTSDYTFANIVYEKLQQHPDISYYCGDVMQRLGYLRGKLVIMRQFGNDGGNSMGAPLVWDDNTKGEYGTSNHFIFYVQDHYSLNWVDYSTKQSEINSTLSLAHDYPDHIRLNLNFTSGEKSDRSISIWTVASNINYWVADRLYDHYDWYHLGQIMVNFAGGSDKTVNGKRGCCPELVRRIIERNDFISVKIGSQVWTAKDLAVTHYRNGDPIPYVTDLAAWSNLTTGAYCIFSNSIYYGYLYNWYAVNDPRGLAPVGSHVPTDADWTTLTNYLGGESVAGGKLKCDIYHFWWDPNTGANNESGFYAIAGGYRNSSGVFRNAGYNGYWWTATQVATDTAKYRCLSYNSNAVLNLGSDIRWGFSVRCLKD